NIQVVLPPLMDNRPDGRPKNKDRIPSHNEEPKITRCRRCGNTGFNRNALYAP
nr:transposase, MuDR, MULE transposase domain protein [Tanacetum cinerariifolium]